MGKPTDVSLDETASQLLERIPEVLQRPESQDQFRSLAVACHGRMLELSELDRTAAIAHALAGARLLSSLQRHCQPQPDWVELHEEQCCRYGAIWIHEELNHADSVRTIVWSMQALALLDRLDQIHQPPPTWTETLRHAFHQQLAPTTAQRRADQEDKPSLSHHLRSPQVLESAELPFPSRLLMVLGMHRSGTSAVAGYLCRHGFLAPTDALPADLKNPTGYWEPQAIVSLHEQLLGDSQTSWDDTWLGRVPLRGVKPEARMP
ncbi:hypothetical protein [Synechococcus sp. CCY9202]|uniref:hypothetical protein n=1 Tax=Synechococcus sp. CCY9202 TaxID=174698 RepID=UPI002B1EB40C|nr:hypothetical protein [Synechococcus sp. CCY9202]MEA5423981.1 hypothetical protein [Synechococcus sp. CCY9202]